VAFCEPEYLNLIQARRALPFRCIFWLAVLACVQVRVCAARFIFGPILIDCVGVSMTSASWLGCACKSLKFRQAGENGFGLFFRPETTKPQRITGNRILRSVIRWGFVILFYVLLVSMP